MNKIKVLYGIVSLFLLSACSGAAGKGGGEDFLGTWKGTPRQKTNTAFFPSCLVTEQGGKMYLQVFTTYNEKVIIDATKRVMQPGDTTVKESAAAMIYDQSADKWMWKSRKETIQVRMSDKDHLVLEYPFEPQYFERVK